MQRLSQGSDDDEDTGSALSRLSRTQPPATLAPWVELGIADPRRCKAGSFYTAFSIFCVTPEQVQWECAKTCEEFEYLRAELVAALAEDSVAPPTAVAGKRELVPPVPRRADGAVPSAHDGFLPMRTGEGGHKELLPGRPGDCPYYTHLPRSPTKVTYE